MRVEIREAFRDWEEHNGVDDDQVARSIGRSYNPVSLPLGVQLYRGARRGVGRGGHTLALLVHIGFRALSRAWCVD